jgi:hypothetical protein
MKRIGGFFCVVASVFLVAYGPSAAAQAVDEVEPNYPMTSAQPLSFGPEVFDAVTSTTTAVATVNAFMGDGDADVFSFSAIAGDVVTMDIDGGYKSGAGSVDTYMSLHRPASLNYAVKEYDDDAALDPGSLGTEDSYIPNASIDADGVYYVSVAGYPNKVSDGGLFNGGPGNATGTYTLIVTLVRKASAPADTGSTPGPTPDPQVQTIGIDIKPGLRVISRINPRSRGEIPVALLSSGTFDATTVDVSSLKFGHSGDEQSLKRCLKRGIDVNRDGKPDLLCFFENQQAGFEPSDEQATLKGMTAERTPFEGTGTLKVIPEKRRGHRRDGDNRHDRDDRGDRGDRGDRRHR